METFKILFLVLFVVAIVVGAPIATILALNILFNLNIPVNTVTWLAAFWLTSVVGGAKITKK